MNILAVSEELLDVAEFIAAQGVKINKIDFNRRHEPSEKFFDSLFVVDAVLSVSVLRDVDLEKIRSLYEISGGKRAGFTLFYKTDIEKNIQDIVEKEAVSLLEKHVRNMDLDRNMNKVDVFYSGYENHRSPEVEDVDPDKGIVRVVFYWRINGMYTY